MQLAKRWNDHAVLRSMRDCVGATDAGTTCGNEAGFEVLEQEGLEECAQCRPGHNQTRVVALWLEARRT